MTKHQWDELEDQIFLSGAYFRQFRCRACGAEAYQEGGSRGEGMRCVPGTPTANHGAGRNPWPRAVGGCDYEAALRTLES